MQLEYSGDKLNELVNWTSDIVTCAKSFRSGAQQQSEESNDDDRCH